MTILSRFSRSFLPLAAVTTILAGLVYAAVQQDIRQGANDPQIQVAEDFAAKYTEGQPVLPINPSLSVDIARSLSPFVLIYDNEGKFVTGSGQLHGKNPAVPIGVLDHARDSGQNRVTWQPEPGVRVALVVARYAKGEQSGFVAVGRSMREIEKREGMLLWYVIAAWLVALAAALVLTVALESRAARSQV